MPWPCSAQAVPCEVDRIGGSFSLLLALSVRIAGTVLLWLLRAVLRAVRWNREPGARASRREPEWCTT